MNQQFNPESFDFDSSIFGDGLIPQSSNVDVPRQPYTGKLPPSFPPSPPSALQLQQQGRIGVLSGVSKADMSRPANPYAFGYNVNVPRTGGRRRRKSKKSKKSRKSRKSRKSKRVL